MDSIFEKPGDRRMERQIHISFTTLLLLVVGVGGFSLFILFNLRHPVFAETPARLEPDFAALEAEMTTSTAIEPQLLDYLTADFCAGGLCRSGSWGEWIILDAQSSWEIAELQLLRTSLLITMSALDNAGFDGYDLLSGYHFRRSQGIYLPGELGTLARIHYDRQEIILADGALKKQWGFYIFHELGHVVDCRLRRAPTQEFQRLTLGEKDVGSTKTAPGFWLNKFAREDPEEAAADAFALWMVLNHTTNPQPVFWLKPEGTSYESIAGVMKKALTNIAGNAN